MPVLSLEFVRDRRLYVWRLQFQVNGLSVDDLVIRIKSEYPKYMSRISTSQLARLVRFAAARVSNGITRNKSEAILCDLNKMGDSELDRIKADMSVAYEANLLRPEDKSYRYDFEINFPTPRGGPFDEDI
jgi:hypothetical protein